MTTCIETPGIRLSKRTAVAKESTNTLSYRLKYALRFFSMSQSELARSIGVKPQVIQYLCMRTIKSSRFSYEIADALGVNYSWLVAGEGEMMPTIQQGEESYKIPCLEWADLDKYYNGCANEETKKHLMVTVSNHEACFALELNDNSMEPRIDKGTILIFGKNIVANNGDFVLVRLNKAGTWIVRQLSSESDERLLLPVNNHIFKTIILDGADLIAGVMLQTIRNYRQN